MGRFIEGEDRQQVTLLPECLDDFIAEDNPVRVIDAFVGELDLAGLGFEGATPAATGRPSYHPAAPLGVYIYSYLNRIQSSRVRRPGPEERHGQVHRHPHDWVFGSNSVLRADAEVYASSDGSRGWSRTSSRPGQR